jgi:hypothetical protein
MFFWWLVVPFDLSDKKQKNKLWKALPLESNQSKESEKKKRREIKLPFFLICSIENCPFSLFVFLFSGFLPSKVSPIVIFLLFAISS